MNAIHKTITLSYEIAQHEHMVETREGPVLAQDGDAIITGSQGERYPVPSAVFGKTYRKVPDSLQCVRLAKIVKVTCEPVAFEVTTPQGAVLRGKAGDYRVEYAPGDQAVVSASVFHTLYDIL